MGKMKNLLLEIEEMHYAGYSKQSIADRLCVSLKTVDDALYQFIGPQTDDDFYEDDEDGNS